MAATTGLEPVARKGVGVQVPHRVPHGDKMEACDICQLETLLDDVTTCYECGAKLCPSCELDHHCFGEIGKDDDFGEADYNE